jgi:hypothetical protein
MMMMIDTARRALPRVRSAPASTVISSAPAVVTQTGRD